MRVKGVRKEQMAVNSSLAARPGAEFPPVPGRLAELDASYHRRMAVSVPLALALLATFLTIAPPGVVIAPNPRVGLRGPFEVVPQMDIVPEVESEQHLTAAPPAARPADFVAVDLDYAFDPKEQPRPTPTPAPAPDSPEDKDLSETAREPDQSQALETTGHPVLGRTDYEVVRWERPVYPREAIQAGVQGEVEAMMLVDAHGRVSQTSFMNPGRYPILERAVTEAMSKCLFRPYVVDGKPTPFWIRTPFQFRLVPGSATEAVHPG